LKWKENLAQKAAAAFLRRQQDTTNLQKLVYGNGRICFATSFFHTGNPGTQGGKGQMIVVVVVVFVLLFLPVPTPLPSHIQTV